MTEWINLLVSLSLSEELVPPEVLGIAEGSTDAEFSIHKQALAIVQYGDRLMVLIQQQQQKKGDNHSKRKVYSGDLRGTHKVACAMLQHGIDYDVVMKETGLSIEELVQLSQ